VRGHCSSLIRQHFLSDGVEYGVGCSIMFGCFVNLWEVEGFFKKSLGSMGGLYRSLIYFFGKLWPAIFFQKFRDPYVKTRRQ
jgi:hypothetical protein